MNKLNYDETQNLLSNIGKLYKCDFRNKNSRNC